MKNLEAEAESLLHTEGIKSYVTPWGVCGVINGIQVEWNTRCLCLRVGWKNSPSDLDGLKRSLEKAHFTLYTPSWKKVLTIKETTLEAYSRLIEWALRYNKTLESPCIIRESYGKIGKPDLQNLCVNTLIAKRVKYAVDNQDPGVLVRDLMDSVDGQITIAQSINYSEGKGLRYREHAVPCDLLYREAVRMYTNGANLYEIAAVIKRYLLIVLITTEEAFLLDTTHRLKTEMPADWKLGDSPFARFEFAKIKLVSL